MIEEYFAMWTKRKDFIKRYNENFPETEQYKKAIQNLSNNSLSEITKVIRQQEKERLEIAKLELLMRRRRKTI